MTPEGTKMDLEGAEIFGRLITNSLDAELFVPPPIKSSIASTIECENECFTQVTVKYKLKK